METLFEHIKNTLLTSIRIGGVDYKIDSHNSTSFN